MTYNISRIDSMSTMMGKMNEFSEGVAGVMTMLLFGIVIFTYGAKEGKKNALVAGTFFMALAGVLARIMGFINTFHIFLFFVLLVGVMLFISVHVTD